jgi:hypothetical protein
MQYLNIPIKNMLHRCPSFSRDDNILFHLKKVTAWKQIKILAYRLGTSPTKQVDRLYPKVTNNAFALVTPN